MKAIAKVVAFGVVELAVFGLVLFLLAGTVDYWQVWTFLVVFALSTWIPTVYLQCDGSRINWEITEFARLLTGAQ